jgi:alkanesulfonate monooxygenase SsuD/methylene tetrahydromethanopterin reductase-like flavin-dependent oxidoreductase (luciferase family)
LEVITMHAGFALGNIGPIGTAANLKRIAQRAEALGYHSLNSVERLLWPVKPQTPYPVTADGSLPEPYQHNLDPLDVLTFIAPLTKTIRLRPSVLDIPYYNPVLLARRLATIDVVSGGRLEVGFGLGWSADEYQATEPSSDRGARADEFLQVLKAIWTTDPVEHQGKPQRAAPR